ncbi:MAG: hypothetical protein BWY63_02030 [Chloroflexi bacterium ADurb.Bin360]|nr:MAG: hypothetical protein BWY63_02030 [Chloroflexi bacterium ADurb.Bin360]
MRNRRRTGLIGFNITLVGDNHAYRERRQIGFISNPHFAGTFGNTAPERGCFQSGEIETVVLGFDAIDRFPPQILVIIISHITGDIIVVDHGVFTKTTTIISSLRLHPLPAKIDPLCRAYLDHLHRSGSVLFSTNALHHHA